MKYELAKQLKEAGWPQDERDHTGQHFIDPSGRIYNHSTGDPDECLIPTLEELIEACGDDSPVMWKYGGVWHAAVFGGAYISRSVVDASYPIHEGEGSTPSEAVAKLWLALNQP